MTDAKKPRKPRTPRPRGADRQARGPRRHDPNTGWHSAAIRRRMHAAGMTTWELADLLGVHEHQVDLEELPELPVKLWLALARRLDLHPADIIHDGKELFDLPRVQPVHDARDQAGPDDALRVITALAHAGVPLDVQDLAAALHWPLDRTAEALDHAHTNPSVGGALALRDVPPEHYTATPRLDLLTHEQHDQLIGPHPLANGREPSRGPRRHQPLSPQETDALMSLVYGLPPQAEHEHTIAALVYCGLVLKNPYADDLYQPTNDVLDSLRLTDALRPPAADFGHLTDIQPGPPTSP